MSTNFMQLFNVALFFVQVEGQFNEILGDI